ncbi:hypothetical protein J6590_101325 [Homalodisca vitripennis]|nr:hypothetical protein J6590_101325 [Homalodisca vitripennis]
MDWKCDGLYILGCNRTWVASTSLDQVKFYQHNPTCIVSTFLVILLDKILHNPMVLEDGQNRLIRSKMLYETKPFSKITLHVLLLHFNGDKKG